MIGIEVMGHGRLYDDPNVSETMVISRLPRKLIYDSMLNFSKLRESFLCDDKEV